MTVEIIHGDCRDVLRDMKARGITVDSVVCDPPYHLTSIVRRFGANGAAPAKPGKTGAYARASAGFMGKQWDGGDVAFQADTWRAVFDVLKPGGHLIAFSGQRTYHRMVTAIEDAGFEVRDQILDLVAADTAVLRFMDSLSTAQVDAFLRCIEESQFGGQLGWLFGSGFPKSHDVSKTIDKRRDWTALPKLQGAIRAARKRVGISQSEAARRCGLIGPDESLGGGGFMWFETGMRMPTRDQWPMLKAALKLADEFDACFEAAEREVIGQHADGSAPGGFGDHRFTFNSRDITAPATDAAKQWEGWGTALKPGMEPILLARKPLVGTVAANVQKHGVGAINIDGCRIATDDNPSIARRASAPIVREGGTWANDRRSAETFAASRPGESLGRFPANVIHDGSEDVVSVFPTDAGAIAPVIGDEPSNASNGLITGRRSRVAGAFHGDGGSAARFFYSAKADADDRLGSKHPTVKPIDLMAYLCRLVTPAGGTVLDPFAGSGTTGVAALREGFKAILIEMEADSIADIHTRIEWAKGNGKHTSVVKARGRKPNDDHGPLFGGTPESIGGGDSCTGSSPKIGPDNRTDRNEEVAAG